MILLVVWELLAHFLKKNGFSVISGDILNFAYCFQVARIAITDLQNFNRLALNTDIGKHLNSLPGCDGWLVRHYAVERKYFTLENARKIQACINTIWKWNEKNVSQILNIVY